MRTRPTLQQRVRCIDNQQLRHPVPVGTLGVCVGDVANQNDLAWVQFDGAGDTQSVNWRTEIEEVDAQQDESCPQQPSST